MIAIIDYGVCNVGSIENMLRKIGEKDIRIVRNPIELTTAGHVILPGVGSFDSGMNSLGNLNLIDAIKDYVRAGYPILGICLGMQLLGRSSEEGILEGLNLIPMECKRFEFKKETEFKKGNKLKVPHMGWDRVSLSKDSKLLKGIEEPQRYYFVHSYYAVCDERSCELMSCNYGQSFSAAVQKGNVYGCQFHPEKSHKYGMKLLQNFVENC